METTDWNWRLVESYVDDSLHERHWVDRFSANGLVENIMTAFGTRIPPESMYAACELIYPERYRNAGVTYCLLLYFSCEREFGGTKGKTVTRRYVDKKFVPLFLE